MVIYDDASNLCCIIYHMQVVIFRDTFINERLASVPGNISVLTRYHFLNTYFKQMYKLFTHFNYVLFLFQIYR